MIEVMVQVTDDTARGLNGQISPAEETRELLDAARALGVTLEALHPGESDPTLARHFRVSAPNPEAGQRIAEVLRRLRAVEGAYVTPPEAPP